MRVMRRVKLRTSETVSYFCIPPTTYYLTLLLHSSNSDQSLTPKGQTTLPNNPESEPQQRNPNTTRPSTPKQHPLLHPIIIRKSEKKGEHIQKRGKLQVEKEENANPQPNTHAPNAHPPNLHHRLVRAPLHPRRKTPRQHPHLPALLAVRAVLALADLADRGVCEFHGGVVRCAAGVSFEGCGEGLGGEEGCC